MIDLLLNRKFYFTIIGIIIVSASWLFTKAEFYGKQYPTPELAAADSISPTPTPAITGPYTLELNQLTELEKNTADMLNESVAGEQIKDFTVNINVQKDGSLNVREDIRYYFDTSRHGIYRNIPFTIYDDGVRYDMEYKFSDVVDENGKKYKVDKGKSGEQWVLKIGDPDKTITGDHTYVISYTVKGGLRYFEDHDELYWNITGNWG